MLQFFLERERELDRARECPGLGRDVVCRAHREHDADTALGLDDRTTRHCYQALGATAIVRRVRVHPKAAQ